MGAVGLFSSLWAEGLIWWDKLRVLGNRLNNFITWQVDGTPSYQLGAGAVGPDAGPDGVRSGRDSYRKN